MKGCTAIRILTLGCLVAGGGTASAAAESNRPPNLVVILADDLGAKELACYGNTTHRTPNLDQLAAEGVRFRTAWATPLCAPTRVQLITGQYPHRTGFYGSAGLRPPANSSLNDIGSKFTIADLLKSRGYATAVAGKWQLGERRSLSVRNCGFDEYRIWANRHDTPEDLAKSGHEMPTGEARRYWDPWIIENGRALETRPEDYGPDLFTDFMIRFVHRNRDRPFFLYFPIPLAHSPHYTTPDTTRTPDDRTKDSPRNYAANVEYLDACVGRLVAAIDEAGLREKTVIFFLSDNGTQGKGKGRVSESGVRVPFLVRGPGHIRGGVVSDALAGVCDVLPTLADLSGARTPKGYPIDGVSLLPVLRGEKRIHRNWVYSYLEDERMIRDERWLLEGDGRLYRYGLDGRSRREADTESEPDAAAARERFEAILATLPGPESMAHMLTPASKEGRWW